MLAMTTSARSEANIPTTMTTQYPKHPSPGDYRYSFPRYKTHHTLNNKYIQTHRTHGRTTHTTLQHADCLCLFVITCVSITWGHRTLVLSARLNSCSHPGDITLHVTIPSLLLTPITTSLTPLYYTSSVWSARGTNASHVCREAKLRVPSFNCLYLT